jgi:hypothetical protein
MNSSLIIAHSLLVGKQQECDTYFYNKKIKLILKLAPIQLIIFQLAILMTKITSLFFPKEMGDFWNFFFLV